MNIGQAVSKRVVGLLKEKNMTQYKLEKKSFISHGNMNNIVSARNKSISVTTLFRLARGFEMSVTEFLDHEIFKSEELDFE